MLREGREHAALTKLYGQNLDLEMKHAENAVAAFGPRDPEKMRSFLDRQMADGTKLGDDPEMIQMLGKVLVSGIESANSDRSGHGGPLKLANAQAPVE